MSCASTVLAAPEGNSVPGVSVRAFEESIARRWDEFVRSQRTGSMFHLTAWKRALEHTFGYEPRFVYAERNGHITGVLPLFRVKNWVIGDCLISTPFGVYGGICAADEQSEAVLLQHAKTAAEQARVQHLELRLRRQELHAGFHRNPLYVTFVSELSSSNDENLKRLPRDTRYMIRKAEKAGLRAQYGFDQLGEFYKLFAISMQRHGTPLFPMSWFQNLISEFHNDAELMMVYKDTQPITGVLSFRYHDTILPYYAGAAPEATKLAANNFMYWELMKRSVSCGLRWFDFGRSKKGTGSFAFKTQWNMSVEPLDYQLYLVRRKEVPNFSPLNPKFQLASRIWNHIPLSATTWIGPRVVRWFP